MYGGMIEQIEGRIIDITERWLGYWPDWDFNNLECGSADNGYGIYHNKQWVGNRAEIFYLLKARASLLQAEQMRINAK